MFYTTAIEHSPTNATGTGWERTPWHATRRAAWEALLKAEENRHDADRHADGTYAAVAQGEAEGLDRRGGPLAAADQRQASRSVAVGAGKRAVAEERRGR